MEVDEADVARNAKVISSRTVFRMNTEENNDLHHKSRIVVLRNREDEHEMVSQDCASAEKKIVRLVMSLEMCLGFPFRGADVKGAYIQSG